MANAVVAGTDLMEQARALAQRVVEAAPLAVAAIMEADTRTHHLGIDEAFGRLRSGELTRYQSVLASEDAREGPRAFTEGRRPRWSGR